MPARTAKPPKPAKDSPDDRIVAAQNRPPAVVITEGMLETIPVDLIDVDVITRPLHEAKVISIAESIATVGLQQPITVFYKAPGDRYILGFGRHRLEATRRLGKDVIRAFVKPAAAIEEIELIQAIENLHRAECTPMEEANYCKIVLIGGLSRSVEDAAGLIGWTVKTFQRRLDLLGLSPRLQQLLNDGKMKLGEAQLLARLADHAEQEVVAGMAEFDDDMGSCLPLDALKYEVERRMLSLESVPWRMDMEFAGKVACNACPSNSANAPALFDGDRPKGTLCLNAACYRIKRDMAAEQLKTAVKVMVNGTDISKITLAKVKTAMAGDPGAAHAVITPESLLAGVKAKADKAAMKKPTKSEKKGRAIAKVNYKNDERLREWHRACEDRICEFLRSRPIIAAGVVLMDSNNTDDVAISVVRTPVTPKKKTALQKMALVFRELAGFGPGSDVEALVDIANHAAKTKDRYYPLNSGVDENVRELMIEAWAIDVPPKPGTEESDQPKAVKPAKKGGKSK